MAANLRATSATQEELIAYLKQHRIWNAETLLWRWLLGTLLYTDHGCDSNGSGGSVGSVSDGR